MGRQIAVVLDPTDEARFLEFMRSLGPVRVFSRFAPSPDSLSVDGFENRALTHLLWYTDFPWSPQYARAKSGEYYVRNTAVAPLLEYTRPPKSQDEAGRLYWAKDFSGEPEYDSETFSQRVDTIWGWVRRTARSGRFAGRSGVWLFPAALERLKGAQDAGAA